MIQNANREIGLGLTIVVLSLAGLFIAIPLGVDAPEDIEVRPLAPDFWPFIVLVFAGLAGAVVTLEGLVGRKRPPHAQDTGTTEEARPDAEPAEQNRPAGEAAMRVAAAIGALFLLYFALPYTGIVAGCMLLLLFMLRFSGERRWHIILAITIVLPLLLYFFFVYVANVPMPMGVFEDFS